MNSSTPEDIGRRMATGMRWKATTLRKTLGIQEELFPIFGSITDARRFSSTSEWNPRMRSMKWLNIGIKESQQLYYRTRLDVVTAMWSMELTWERSFLSVLFCCSILMYITVQENKNTEHIYWYSGTQKRCVNKCSRVDKTGIRYHASMARLKLSAAFAISSWFWKKFKRVCKTSNLNLS